MGTWNSYARSDLTKFQNKGSPTSLTGCPLCLRLRVCPVVGTTGWWATLSNCFAACYFFHLHQDLDGVSMWNELRSDLPSRREEMLYNINEIHSSTRQVNAGIRCCVKLPLCAMDIWPFKTITSILRLRDMKLIRGSPAVGNHIAGEPPFERLAVAGERSKVTCSLKIPRQLGENFFSFPRP